MSAIQIPKEWKRYWKLINKTQIKCSQFPFESSDSLEELFQNHRNKQKLTAKEIFLTLLNEDQINSLVKNTNENFENVLKKIKFKNTSDNQNKFKITTNEEIKTFFGVYLLMEKIHLVNYSDHFDRNNQFFYSPINEIMSQVRFDSLNMYVSLNEINSIISLEEKFNIIVNLFIKEKTKFYKINGEIIIKFLEIQFNNMSLLVILLYEYRTGICFECKIQVFKKNELQKYYEVLKIFFETYKDHIFYWADKFVNLNLIESVVKAYNIKILAYIDEICIAFGGIRKEYMAINKEISGNVKTFHFRKKIGDTGSFTDILYLKRIMKNKSFHFTVTNCFNFNKETTPSQDQINYGFDKIECILSKNTVFYNQETNLIHFIIEILIQNAYILFLNKNNSIDFLVFRDEIISYFMEDCQKNNSFYGTDSISSEKTKSFHVNSSSSECNVELKQYNQEQKTIEYGHFPFKIKNWCKKCKVCQKQQINNIRKSKYKCRKCSENYKRDIPLCVHPCFEQFHENTEFYMKRKKRVYSKLDPGIRKIQKLE